MIDINEYEDDFGIDDKAVVIGYAINSLDNGQKIDFFAALIDSLDSDSIFRLEDAIGMTI